MAKRYTPGPWEAGISPLEGGGRYQILTGPGVRKAYLPQTRQNADLISAAPDLLEALENVLDFYEYADALSPEIIELGNAAIAKAKGKK